MSSQYSCDLCQESFASNFRLYQHKARDHLSTVGIVSNDNGLKSKVSSGELDNPYSQNILNVNDNKNGNRGKKRSYSSDEANDAVIKKRQKTEHRVSKRFRENYSDEDVPNAEKYRKIDKRGIKRKRIYDGIGSQAKNRSIEKGGIKRERSYSDDGDSSILGKRRKIEHMGKKRTVSPEHDRNYKYRKIEPDLSDGYISDVDENKSGYRSLINKLKTDVVVWRRKYNASNKKLNQTKLDCKAKMDVLKRQLQEFEEFDGDKELDGLSRVIFNGVTIQEFNKIRGLINENKISQLLRGRKNIITLQKLFLGLIYGIIPITNPQRVALTNDEKNMVRSLENATVEEVKLYIQKNSNTIRTLFSTINDSIKLVTDSYQKYN